MYISKVTIRNFRLLKNSSLDLRKNLSLLIGKNNSGKTSLFVLFENFFDAKMKFQYNDFSLVLREQIHTISNDTEIGDLSIRMIIEIEYDEEDDLENISDFILDLDPEIETVKILFECSIDKDLLLKDIPESLDADERKDLIAKNLRKYLKNNIYVFNDLISASDSTDTDIHHFLKINPDKRVKKDLKDVKNLINFHVIHARRNVASSEESNAGKKPLSKITTAFFNSKNDTPNDELTKIDKLLVDTDDALNKNYKAFFKDFLENSKTFLGSENKLNVISNIQSNMLLDNASQVTYGFDEDQLPEHLNGLGYLNILFLLLQIEITKEDFKKQQKDICLLFIEEPEAHTHPQMQYVFANQIQKILEEINGLQTLITTHSSHIVTQSNFKDIRYLKLKDNNIEIKNFHIELKEKYSEEQEQFKFLEQYLDIQASELFFASKVIFIEGITERILLPYFIHQYDLEHRGEDNFIPLESQNISVLEVGANAKVFAPFLDFMGIKTLIITDIDTINKKTRKKVPVIDDNSNDTSNTSLKYFLEAPEDDAKQAEWFNKLRGNTLESISENIKIAYQTSENDYHARSFEDAFISINKAMIQAKKDNFLGLKNKSSLDTDDADIYNLTDNIIDKKSGFASSLLFLALSQDDVKWRTPLYIKEGLEWINKP